MLIEALEVQKSGRHKEEEGLVRPCFEAPNFPDVRELYHVGLMKTHEEEVGRRRKEDLEEKLEKKEKKLKTAKVQLEVAKREIAMMEGEQQPAQGEQQEEAGGKRPREAAPAAESAKRPKPTA